MVSIKSVFARSILDSKGIPTVETTITLSDNSILSASVPSGTSVGRFEAKELRDDDPNQFEGKSVNRAVNNVNTVIAQNLTGKDPRNQEKIDDLLLSLDGSQDKSNLGANAIISASIAVAKAGAKVEKLPLYKYIANLCGNQNLTLPRILSNLINGGLHAGKNVDIQEFLVIPYRVNSIRESIRQLVHINAVLRETLIASGFQPLVGDEGGFAPHLESNEKALSLLEEVVRASGFVLGNDIYLGMDAAASSFYKDGYYHIKDLKEDLTGAELGTFYKQLAERYQLLYLEDPFSEDDIPSWQAFPSIAPQTLIITGDDLTVTNPERLAMALEKQLIRGIIIKPNQIGTLTEALKVVNHAKQAGLQIIVSHRSGETDDDFIADIAVGVSSNFAKFGAPVRGERVAKYNRLLKIESELTGQDI